MVGINLDIPPDIHDIFSKKHHRSQKSAILDLIKADIGWTDDYDDKRLSTIDCDIAELQKERNDIIERKEAYHRKKKDILVINKDKIKELFNGSVGATWEDSPTIAKKLHLIGLEGFTEGDVWGLFNERL